MDDKPFEINSKAQARRAFPVRFLEVAAKAHGYELDDDYGLKKDIANRLDVDRSAVTRWLKGSIPGIKNLIKIAEAYNVSPNYLVGNDNDDSEFSLRQGSRLSWEQIHSVLLIMAEVRADAGKDVSDAAFADACIEILRMVEAAPGMPEYAITGAAYRLIKADAKKSNAAD